MSEENLAEEVVTADSSLWDDINWSYVKKWKISKEDFMSVKAANSELYATFLGLEDNLEFYMFIPLSWDAYKEIKQGNQDKLVVHDSIIKNCLVWPKLTPKDRLSAGVVMTLVYQILSRSNFLPDISQSLKMIIEA